MIAMKLQPNQIKRISRIFIWVGVLAWAPYLTLVFMGRDVSILPFLAFHLTGLLGGLRLRNMAAEAEGALKKVVSKSKKISRVMILLGVSAWFPYLYLINVQGQDVAIGPYLSVHLPLVIGGITIQIREAFRKG